MGKASTQLFSGAGLGLMLGLLLGLSGTPVVAAVVGAIAALLGALVLPQIPGMAADGQDTPRPVVDLRAGALGLACVVGILGGIWLRTHDALSPRSPTLTEKWEQWKAIGFSPDEARMLVARGVPDAASGALSGAAAGTGPGTVATAAARTILFGDRTTRCEQLSAARFADTDAAARTYETWGEHALARIARGLSRLPDAEARRAALAVVVEASCGGA